MSKQIQRKQAEGILITSASAKGSLIRSVFNAATRLHEEAFPDGGSEVSSESGGKPTACGYRNTPPSILPRLSVWLADSDPSCLARTLSPDFWQMPELEQLHVDELLDFCLTNDIGFIIPTRDGELTFFCELQKRLGEKGIVVMVSAPATIACCRDKLVFASCATDLGLPVVPTLDGRTAGSLALKTRDWRTWNTAQGGATVNAMESIGETGLFVVKERYGAGSQGVSIRVKAADVPERAAQLKCPIVQPFIDGKEFSADIYCDPAPRAFTADTGRRPPADDASISLLRITGVIPGRARGIVLRWRDEVVNGESTVTTTFRNPAIEQAVCRLAAGLGLQYHSVVQGIASKEHPGSFVLLEANARFGGSSALSLAAGLDSFYWFLRDNLLARGVTTSSVTEGGPLIVPRVRMQLRRRYDPARSSLPLDTITEYDDS